MASTRDFLFEIGVEEMPSAPLNNAVKQLKVLVAWTRLACPTGTSASSPRRAASPRS